MNNLLKFMMNIFLLISLIMLMINKLNLKMKNNNFMNNIECGFNNMNNKHIPIYNNFFMIMIIFLIFDLEFFLLIPLILLFNKLNWLKLMMMMLIIFFYMFFFIMWN